MAKKEFQAESRRLLELMINSIYTHQEIFLRELISNASDAIDKLCFRSLTDENVGMERGDFFIRIKGDKENGTLTISDNGIGMTAEEMESNLGVIAKSGSLAFKKDLDAAEKDKADIDVIGQFGVGFYSAFMVASKVTVVSRAYGQETANRWESEGADGHSLREGDRRHRCHPHHEERHRGRLLQRVSHALEDPGACEEIFGLCPLADPHRCGDDRKI